MGKHEATLEMPERVRSQPTPCIATLINNHSFALQLGAFTIIVAAAIDPFSQQLVQFERLLDEDDPTPLVSIARAQRYSKGFKYSERMVVLSRKSVVLPQFMPILMSQSMILNFLKPSPIRTILCKQPSPMA